MSETIAPRVLGQFRTIRDRVAYAASKNDGFTIIESGPNDIPGQVYEYQDERVLEDGVSVSMVFRFSGVEELEEGFDLSNPAKMRMVGSIHSMDPDGTDGFVDFVVRPNDDYHDNRLNGLLKVPPITYFREFSIRPNWDRMHTYFKVEPVIFIHSGAKRGIYARMETMHGVIQASPEEIYESALKRAYFCLALVLSYFDFPGIDSNHDSE